MQTALQIYSSVNGCTMELFFELLCQFSNNGINFFLGHQDIRGQSLGNEQRIDFELLHDDSSFLICLCAV